MPREPKELYRRGQFWLGWDRKLDGSLRSPFLAIFWYDPERGRERSTSTRTADVEQARHRLDAHYLERDRGASICPTCGQQRAVASGFLVTDAISNYQILHGQLRASSEAIAARLAHVVRYIATLPSAAVTCEQVNDEWVQRFRTWLTAQPIVSTGGNHRARSASTVENSVIQLAAVINAAHRRGDASRAAGFRPIPLKELSATPQHRATVPELAAMFRYALSRKRQSDGAGLHRFLIASVSTLARPDAAHEISTAADRGQWNSQRRVLDLNPRGRRQTKKYRATVRVPWQFAEHLDNVAGKFVPVSTVRSAWRGMAIELNLPGDGESGMKLIRRSVAQLLRDRRVPAEEIELMMGHRKLDAVTDLYAAFRPEHLSNAVTALEGIIDEIEGFVPGAFHRKDTGQTGSSLKLISGGVAKNG